MQSDKQWNLEAVTVLGAGLMISLSLGMLLSLALRRFVPNLSPADEKFYTFVVSSVSFQGVALLLTHSFLKQHEMTWKEFLGLKGPSLKRALLLAFGTAALVLPATLGLNTLSAIVIKLFHGTPELQPPMQVLEISVSLGQRICFGAAAILAAPLVEEILFRGILYLVIQQRGYPKLALFGSAVLFGAIHLNLMTFVPLTFLGVVLALLYERTGNLMAPIVAHSIFNAVNFFIFIYQEGVEHWWREITRWIQSL